MSTDAQATSEDLELRALPRVDERRRYVRYEVAREVTLVSGLRSVSAVSQNISLGGARLIVDYGMKLARGDQVTCVFAPSEATKIRIDGIVRWVTKDYRQRLGVQFHVLLSSDQLLAFVGSDPDESLGPFRPSYDVDDPQQGDPESK